MTIIKAADLGSRSRLQGLSLGASRRTPLNSTLGPGEVALAELRLALADAEDRLTDQQAELEDRRRDALEAYAKGEAAGRAIGLDEAQSLEDERLQILTRSVAQAAEQIQTALSDLEPLAVLIARESLAQILGDPQNYGDLISKIVRRQLDRVRDEALLVVEVSAKDFADVEDVKSLVTQTQISQPGVAVDVSDGLEAGDCRLRFKLGTQDVGVRQQWGQLSTILADMAEHAR